MVRSALFACVWILPLTWLHGQEASVPVFEVHTNRTWRVTASAPPAGWNREVDFDDSGPTWVDATQEGDASRTIWHSSINAGASPNRIWFRKVVWIDPINAQPERGSVEYGKTNQDGS